MKTTSEITLKRTEIDYISELSTVKNEVVTKRQGGGGKELSYIAGKWYIIRLNEVAKENWSWEVVSIQPTGISYLCHGRLTIDGVSRDGIGGADLKFAKGTNDKTPQNVASEGFENCVKSAETDAFKRACEKFGLGLWLSLDEESAKYAQTDEQRQDNLDDFKRLLQDPNSDRKEKNKAYSRLTKPEQAEVKKIIEEQQKLLNK